VELKQLFLKCQKLQGQETMSLVLQGTGLLSDAASCHVTMEGLQLYPELHGESTFTAQNPSLYSLLLPEVASPKELKILTDITEVQDINSLTHALPTHQSEMDQSSLFRMYTPTVPTVQTPAWHTPALITTNVVSGLADIGLLTSLILPKGFEWCKHSSRRNAPRTQDCSEKEPRTEDSSSVNMGGQYGRTC
jgi:hypothetical protein